jgi:hypothetical protein
MAAKKKARKPKIASAAEIAAIRKSFKEIHTANQHLALLIKKHIKKVSPMYFAL